MTGALRADSKDGFFAQNNVLGPFNRITILRSRDRYLQYATNGTLVDQFHTQPMSEVAYREFLSALRKGAGGNIDQALESGEPVSFQGKTATRGAVQGVALYNPRYEFWLISEIEERFLLRKFLESLAAYSLILVALQIFMYMAFRHIDKVEGKRRDELRFQATHDTLTQLPNRNYLIKRFPVWKREKEEFSLLFIDLDSFKGINDNFGHSTGDKILVELAKRFRSIVGEHELLVRHGGDEFVLLTGGVPLSENEDRVRRSIYDACENITVEGRRFSPGCSVGIARQPHHGTHLDELLRAADIAMYEAKKLRNTAQVFRPALEHKYLHRIRIEQRLRGATKRGEIHMNYQPQINAEGQLYGVESLVRWHSPELGIVPPNEFVHIAEQSGRMGVLGDYIIDRTLREMGALARRYHQEFRVSINISVRQFEDHEFVQRLLEKTHAHGIPAHRLCLELTENLLIEDTDRIQKMLQALHGEGIQIALDDFGTGYSSLSMLRHLPLDEIKIDKSFIDDILEDETALTMVRNIISIARNYRTTILAEGVETYEQLQILKACGCNPFRGYYFSRPLALAALEDYVTQP